jgi:hypothetical protein
MNDKTSMLADVKVATLDVENVKFVRGKDVGVN